MLERDLKNLGYRALSMALIKWSAGAFFLVALYVELPGHFWTCTLGVIWVDAAFSAIMLSGDVQAKEARRASWLDHMTIQLALLSIARGQAPFASEEDDSWWWGKLRNQASGDVRKADADDQEGSPKPRIWLSLLWNLLSTLFGVILAAIVAQGVRPTSF